MPHLNFTDSSKTSRQSKKELILALYKNCDYKESIKHSLTYIGRWPNDAMIRRSLADSYFSISEYKNALEQYLFMHHTLNINLPWMRVQACIDRINKEREERSVNWNRFNRPIDNLCSEALNAGIYGSPREAMEAFSKVVPNLFSENTLSEQAFSSLKESYAFIIQPELYNRERISLPRNDNIQKIVVSGMGWSGSSAIYDYLKEFNNVVAIKGEFPHIEKSRSLKKIKEAITNNHSLKSSILEFFYYALLGHANICDRTDIAFKNYAEKAIKHFGEEEYISRVRNWCFCASDLLSAPDCEKIDRLKYLSTFTINNFCLIPSVEDGCIALLDNVVHIGNVECIEFLEHTSLICSFRDPRSNYAALKIENPHFNKDVKSFIRTRRNNTEKHISHLQNLISDRGYDNIYPLRFEEFVLNERLRDHISKMLGLNLDDRVKYMHFKPWESYRNTVLHQEYHNQEEIRLIEQELPEYCVELGVKPLKDTQENVAWPHSFVTYL